MQLLLDFVQRGREADPKAVELEVFVQNERAANLYRRHARPPQDSRARCAPNLAS